MFAQGMLKARQIAVLVGRSGQGKSYFTIQWGYALAGGRSWSGLLQHPEPRSVLYVQAEGSEEDGRERLAPVEAIYPDLDTWHYWVPDYLALHRPSGEMDLRKMLKEFRPDVVFFDSLYSCFTGLQLQNAAEMGQAFGIARKLRQEFNHAQVWVHHETKPIYHDGEVVDRGANAMAGSWVIEAQADRIWHFKSHTKDGPRTLEPVKVRSRLDTINPFEIELDQETGLLSVRGLNLTENDLAMRDWLRTAAPCPTKDAVSWAERYCKMSRSTAYDTVRKVCETPEFTRSLSGDIVRVDIDVEA